MTNKIIVKDHDIVFNLDSSINGKILSDESAIIKVVSLDILNDTMLKIEYNIKEELKINFNLNIKNNVSLKLIDEKNGKNIKSKYHYYLNEKANININKIHDTKNIKEFDLIDLNGVSSKVNYVLKTISTTNEHYDVIVNHNNSYTESDIITNGINMEDGVLVFDITSYVPKKNISTVVNQNSHIINFTKNRCQINPNLLIDEMDSSANHSAHISKFSDEDLFYLQSRGINENNALKLLMKGFLMDNIVDKEYKFIDSIIKKYWG